MISTPHPMAKKTTKAAPTPKAAAKPAQAAPKPVKKPAEKPVPAGKPAARTAGNTAPAPAQKAPNMEKSSKKTALRDSILKRKATTKIGRAHV